MKCVHCNETLGSGMLICPRCGTRVSGLAPARQNANATPLPPVFGTSVLTAQTMPQYAMMHAGFWRRVGAFLIDAMLVGATAFLAQQSLLPLIGGVVVWWLYYALFESSRWQATPGKRLLDLKVTDVNGVRIKFGRASLRFFGRLLSSAILFIGFLMAAWTRDKQALHDLIANTLVLRKH